MPDEDSNWAHLCDDVREPPSGTPGGPHPVALLVLHGMGQQVPFETLEAVVQALRRAEERAGRRLPDACVRRVELPVEGKPEPFNRAELTLGSEAGRKAGAAPAGVRVHAYEAYWAPIPEGAVHIGDVVLFLAQPLLKNLRVVGLKSFLRYLFGGLRSFAINGGWTFVQLLAVGAFIGSLLVLNAAVSLVVVLGLLTSSGEQEWLTAERLWNLLRAVALLTVPALCFWLGMRILPSQPAVSPAARSRPSSITASSRLGWLFVVLGLFELVVIAGVVVWLMFTDSAGEPPSGWLTPTFGLLWFALLAATRHVRGVLVQYVGDVAAYVSAHTVNRFWRIRSEIFQASMRVARAVYGARDEHGEPLYREVVVVGHSLGSLIAYDTLNGMLLEDQLAARALRVDASGRKPRDVVHRTAALVTTGSPLDKIAFLFRILRPLDERLREVLSNTVQPLIQAPEFRPRRWINIYSWNDVISGRLDFFDWPAPPRSEKDADERSYRGAVENLHDPAAHRPLLAHNQYWENALFGDKLLEVLGVK